jgi:hypothetical protein
MIKRLAIIAAMLLIPALAKSDTVWTYTGNTMHLGQFSDPAFLQSGGCGCAIDGTFTLTTDTFSSQTQTREWGSPTAWNFTDGTHTLTNANSTAAIELTQLAGGPLLWNISIFNSNWILFSQFIGSGFESQDTSGKFGNSMFSPAGNFGYLEGDRGTLMESVSLGDGDHDGDDPKSTPEPGTLALLGVGLVGLLARKAK